VHNNKSHYCCTNEQQRVAAAASESSANSTIMQRAFLPPPFTHLDQNYASALQQRTTDIIFMHTHSHSLSRTGRDVHIFALITHKFVTQFEASRFGLSQNEMAQFVVAKL
jgi:hypothetical protein